MSVVAHFCHPNTQEAETTGMKLQDQPGLCRKKLSQAASTRNNIQEHANTWVSLKTFLKRDKRPHSPN